MKLMWVDGYMWVRTTKICYFGDQRNMWTHDGLQHKLGYNRKNPLLPAVLCYQKVELGWFQWCLIESANSPPEWHTNCTIVQFTEYKYRKNGLSGKNNLKNELRLFCYWWIIYQSGAQLSTLVFKFNIKARVCLQWTCFLEGLFKRT